MRRARGLAIAVALAAVTGCGGDQPTVVVVTVTPRPGISGATELQMSATNATDSIQKIFPLDASGLPATFSITPTGRSGALSIDVRAVDGSGLLVGLGATSVDIEEGARVDAALLLDPADFVVNTSIAGDQRLTFFGERTGRQLAAGGDGTVLAAFVNDCATLGRCDLFARMFGDTGAAVVNGITMDDEEFIANLSADVASVPAVAVGPSGMFVAWETTDDVRGVALTPGGAHLGAGETTVSTTPGEFPADPEVAALAGGDYVVVWQQSFGAKIQGRLVAGDGTPRINPITGSTADFPISTGGADPGFLPSVASRDDNHAFVVVWRTDRDLRARFFRGTAAAETASESSLGSYAVGARVFGPHVAWADGGAAVVWGVVDSGTPELAGGRYVYRHFSPPSGTPDGPWRYLSPSTPDAFTPPDVAALPGGLVGAVWQGCGADGDGAGCGIWFQLLRPSGLPIGAPRVVNTTTGADQTGPSIAAVGDDRFAVVWTDASATAPDTAGTAIRARWIYPELDPTDGRLGARCGSDAAPCQDGLVCTASSGGAPYCHEGCDPSGPAPQCPSGGICSAAGGDPACLF